MQYQKIHSLWKRQGWYLEEGKKNNPEYQKGRQSFIVGDYALPEFGIIKQWRVSEKVDGTNIRIHLTDKVDFMAVPLIPIYLQSYITIYQMNSRTRNLIKY